MRWFAVGVILFAMGCAQMRRAGRYQRVMIETDPPGASVTIKGGIDLTQPIVYIGKNGKTYMVYTEQNAFRTPLALILDKEESYVLELVAEGFNKEVINMRPHFAFHPYLIVLFPIVPLVSDYEIKAFEDVKVKMRPIGEEEPGEKTEPKEEPAEPGEKAEPEEKTCLLYTSPSPRDLSTSRMPSSA